MKRIIRNSVFETNSSSTHSLTIASKEEYDAWKNGQTLFNKWDNKFIPAREFTEEEKEGIDREIVTYQEFFGMDNFETYQEDYTAESGDQMVVFGFYGQDC